MGFPRENINYIKYTLTTSWHDISAKYRQKARLTKTHINIEQTYSINKQLKAC